LEFNFWHIFKILGLLIFDSQFNAVEIGGRYIAVVGLHKLFGILNSHFYKLVGA
jgi:hypothetical protein